MNRGGLEAGYDRPKAGRLGRIGLGRYGKISDDDLLTAKSLRHKVRRADGQTGPHRTAQIRHREYPPWHAIPYDALHGKAAAYAKRAI